MPKVCVIQHIEIETPGRIADALSAAGHRIETILSHSGQPVPTPLHWHGDVFDLPKGGVALASSELTAHQAYWHGSNACHCLPHLNRRK